MLIPIVLSLAGLVLLILLATMAYSTWVVHRMTTQVRVPVHSHPSQLGLAWEDVTFPSRGDAVTLSAR